MTANNWRHALHTFTDENAQVYTVTNVPPIINTFTSVDPRTLVNTTFGTLLRPKISIDKYPELPFLLRRLPVTDPLLSRLCANPDSLAPSRFESGWALPDDIRNSWIRLEKGLLHVSELLLTSTEQSFCGTSARYAIRDQEHWPHPEDYGYRNVHATAHAAQISTRRAHTAFQLLAARCSLAVALWLFPRPVSSSLPQVPTTESDSTTTTEVPEWVIFLRRARVPSSWIDALGDSVITDFALNLRVGTVFDPSPSAKWPPILPVLRAANVPVFIMWRNPTQMLECAERWPFMKTFAPRSPAEVTLALQHPPTGNPRVVTLCFDAKTRPLPDYSSLDDSAPPFGPYQQPGESRLEFLTRREHYRQDQELQETQLGLTWRRERQAHAQTGFPPYRRSRVYLWVSPKLIYPDLPPTWRGCEYRHPNPPSAYRSIWMVHPLGCRQYNPFYDEWDLWFPPSWGTAQGDSEEARTADSDTDTVLLPASQAAATASAMRQQLAIEQSLAKTLDDDDLLNPTPEDRDIQGVEIEQNFHLSSWFGITITDTRTFPGVDYEKWAARVHFFLGELETGLPQDPAARKCIAGWAAAMLERDWRSRALAFTCQWDLDARNPSRFLPPRADSDSERGPDPRLSLSLEHRRAAERKMDPDDVFRWVLVKFQRDPDEWQASGSPGGLSGRRSRPRWARSCLRAAPARWTRAAPRSPLTAVGVPVRTGILRRVDVDPPPPSDSESARASEAESKPLPAAPSRRRLPTVWREKGERPTVKDYDAYCQRVLGLSHRPHARTAWLKGGIVWRIMLEVTPVTGRNTGLPTLLALEEGELSLG